MPSGTHNPNPKPSQKKKNPGTGPSNPGATQVKISIPVVSPILPGDIEEKIAGSRSIFNATSLVSDISRYVSTYKDGSASASPRPIGVLYIEGDDLKSTVLYYNNAGITTNHKSVERVWNLSSYLDGSTRPLFIARISPVLQPVQELRNRTPVATGTPGATGAEDSRKLTSYLSQLKNILKNYEPKLENKELSEFTTLAAASKKHQTDIENKLRALHKVSRAGCGPNKVACIGTNASDAATKAADAMVKLAKLQSTLTVPVVRFDGTNVAMTYLAIHKMTDDDVQVSDVVDVMERLDPTIEYVAVRAKETISAQDLADYGNVYFMGLDVANSPTDLKNAIMDVRTAIDSTRVNQIMRVFKRAELESLKNANQKQLVSRTPKHNLLSMIHNENGIFAFCAWRSPAMLLVYIEALDFMQRLYSKLDGIKTTKSPGGKGQKQVTSGGVPESVRNEYMTELDSKPLVKDVLEPSSVQLASTAVDLGTLKVVVLRELTAVKQKLNRALKASI